MYFLIKISKYSDLIVKNKTLRYIHFNILYLNPKYERCIKLINEEITLFIE